MTNSNQKTINIKFNKEYHLKFQKEVEKRRYDKESKTFKTIYNKEGIAEKEIKSYISFPTNAIYLDNNKNEISLKGFLLETTSPTFIPHSFDKDGKDLGADDKYLMLKLIPNSTHKVSKTEFIINAEGKKVYDFENQITYYLKAEEIKELMDSWKNKELSKEEKVEEITMDEHTNSQDFQEFEM